MDRARLPTVFRPAVIDGPVQGIVLIAHHTVDVAQMLLGGALFWAPGLTWAWAFLPEAPWSQRLPLSIVLAFTLTPAAMFLLNLVLGVPIRLATTAFLAVTLALLGLLAVLRRYEHLWDLSTDPR